MKPSIVSPSHGRRRTKKNARVPAGNAVDAGWCLSGSHRGLFSQTNWVRGGVYCFPLFLSLQISKQNEVGGRSGVDECSNDMQWIVMTRFGFHGFTTSRKRDLLNHIEPIWNWICLKINHHVGVYCVARRVGDLQELSSQSNKMMICKYYRYSLANQCTNFRKNMWKYNVFPYCYVCLPCYSQDRFCSVEYAARVDDQWFSGLFRVPAGRNRIARNQPQEIKLMNGNVGFSRSPQKDMFPVVGSQDKNMVDDDDDVKVFSGLWNIHGIYRTQMIPTPQVEDHPNHFSVPTFGWFFWFSCR